MDFMTMMQTRKSIRSYEDKPVAREDLIKIVEVGRLTPSACNSQPWKVISEKDKLTVYRYKKPGKRGIMPADKVAYYNRIDIGIFLLFLELCLGHENISFERKLFSDDGDINREDTLIAEYHIKE